MKKEHQLKKEHHYVWANYLRNWSVTKNKVWFRSAKGFLVEDSVKMIAKERHFYHVLSLTKDNVQLIKMHSEKSDMHEAHMKLLNKFLHTQKVENIYKSSRLQNKQVELEFESHRHNTLENFHTAYEKSAEITIKSLADRNLSILDNMEHLTLFFNYLGQQFARTKAFKEMSLAVLAAGNTKESEWIHKNSTESWWFLSHMIGQNIGYSMYSSRNSCNYCLLVNDTEVPFITSDFPSVNVHPELNNNSFEPPTEEQFDLYYPISPTVAFVYCTSNQFPKGISNVDRDVVDKLNSETARYAYIHIFGCNEESLKPYKKLVGERHKRVQTYVKDF